MTTSPSTRSNPLRRWKLGPEWLAGLSATAFIISVILLIVRTFDWDTLNTELSKPETLPTIIMSASVLIFMLAFVSMVEKRSRTRRKRVSPIRRGILGTLFGLDESLEASRSDLGKIEDEVRDLRASVGTSHALTQEVQAEILELYRKALGDKFGSDVGSQVRLLVDQSFKREVEFEATRFLDDVNQRLKAASSTVSARGFLNLILGIAFAGGALMVLQQAISFLSPETLGHLPLSTVVYLMGTRISIALVITLVAYFFLSLYKKSLDDAKFYQNEMTDMSSKAAALHLAYYHGDKELKSLVLSKLADSDRNRNVSLTATFDAQDSGIRIAEKLVDKIPTLKSE